MKRQTKLALESASSHSIYMASLFFQDFNCRNSAQCQSHSTSDFLTLRHLESVEQLLVCTNWHFSTSGGEDRDSGLLVSIFPALFLLQHISACFTPSKLYYLQFPTYPVIFFPPASNLCRIPFVERFFYLLGFKSYTHFTSLDVISYVYLAIWPLEKKT